LSLEDVLDDTRHPLKENNLPDICADRIDYSLRDALKYNICSADDTSYILDHLIVKDHQRIFTNFASAKRYTDIFHHLNEKYYAGIESAIMFQTVKDCLYYSWQQ
jgi:HD superfamily phosphohydrolase